MMPDRVMCAAGMMDAGAFTDEARAVLVEYVLGMRLAGVVLTLAEWESLSTETRAAFIAAGKVLNEYVAMPTATEKPAAGA